MHTDNPIVGAGSEPTPTPWDLQLVLVNNITIANTDIKGYCYLEVESAADNTEGDYLG